jgi:hypothetical protein
VVRPHRARRSRRRLGVRALAREDRKLAALVKERKRRVRDRARAMGRRMPALTRTIRRRSGEAKRRGRSPDRADRRAAGAVGDRDPAVGGDRAPAGAWPRREGQAHRSAPARTEEGSPIAASRSPGRSGGASRASRSPTNQMKPTLPAGIFAPLRAGRKRAHLDVHTGAGLRLRALLHRARNPARKHVPCQIYDIREPPLAGAPHGG